MLEVLPSSLRQKGKNDHACSPPIFTEYISASLILSPILMKSSSENFIPFPKEGTKLDNQYWKQCPLLAKKMFMKYLTLKFLLILI